MLQRIREGAGRWIAGIILGLLGVAFIFWGVDPTTIGSTFAAKVNGEDVTLDEFERAVQLQQQQYQDLYRLELTDDLQRDLRLAVLERLVRTRALSQRAQEEGYRISDERLAEAIRSIPEFQVDGQFSMDVYRSQLLYQGISPTRFEEQQREQLELLDLQNGLATSAFYTPKELARYIEIFQQEREIGYASFEAQSFRDQVVLEESEILTHYENNKARFYTEESVDIEYIEILRTDIAEGIEATDEALEAYYQDEQYRFQTEEERRARHILINSTGDDAQARAGAEEIMGRLEAGEDFEALAMELSDDAGTSAQGGDLGWISPGLLAGPFEEALFAMEVGEIKGPVKTDFGYHIIRLDEIREADVQSFESVKEELAGDYRSSRAEELFYDRANQLADLAFDAFDELASVAAELELPLQTLEGFVRSGAGSPFPNSVPVVQAAFSTEVLEQRENSGLVEVSDDQVLVLRVSDHHPPMEQPLEAVREDIDDELRRAAAETLASEAAAEFLARLAELPVETAQATGDEPAAENETEAEAEAEDEAPGAVAVLAAEHGGEWMPARWLQRTDAEVPTEVLTAAFRARPGPDAPVREELALASGDAAVVVVSGVRAGSADGLTPEERQQQLTQLAQQTAMFEVTSYAGEVREGASVRIPEEILDPPLF